VLVDDGTVNANSKEILQHISGQVDRYIQQPNRGVSAARNTAIRAAAGHPVVPLDSDDALDPRYVATCVAALAANREAAFVYTDYRGLGVAEERILLIPNGVDLDALPPQPGSRRRAASDPVCRQVEAVKRPMLLVDSAAALR